MRKFQFTKTALAVAVFIGGTHVAQADMAAAEGFLSDEIAGLSVLRNEKPAPETIDYDELVKSWTQ